MPLSDSSSHSSQARESLRGLANASRHLPDPGEIYDLLGDISGATTSLAQSLDQIAGVHDRLGPERATVAESRRSGRATSYAVSWELHRAAEMLRQVVKGIDRAHEQEARITYAQVDPLLAQSGQTATAAHNGLHL